jgi:hypothetical protein
MVRPAYEFMPDTGGAPLHGIRYIQQGYGVPESPPQSPPEINSRVRARPYGPLWMMDLMTVVDVLDVLRAVMRIRSSDL